MQSSYKRLGNYIHRVDVRNTDLKVTRLLGLSMTKEFRETTSNIVGTDMSVYKVMSKWQFACDFMSVIRVNKLPVVLKTDDEPNIVSPAYPVFEVNDINELHPEYLMMWFRRSEFDRFAYFKCDSAIRGGFDWEELCDIELPIPHIDKQREIVKEYNTIVNRIKLNEQLNQKLEESAQAIYKKWFVEDLEDGWEDKCLIDLCNLITDGKHADCEDEANSGYYFVSVKDLNEGEIIYENARQITKNDFEETHRRTNLAPGDILLTNSGTIGRMVLVKNSPETTRTTFQKSVAILKPKAGIASSYFLFSMLKAKIGDIIELAGGSTQANLLLGDLKSFPVKYPGKELIQKFENRVKPIFEYSGLIGKEKHNLIITKNLILSKISSIEN